MKTVDKRYFVCEVCGKTSQDEEKIRECQHYLLDDNSQIKHTFTKGGLFPKLIDATFSDGAQARFVLTAVTEAPVKLEGEDTHE